jgi:hypothetical protein
VDLPLSYFILSSYGGYSCSLIDFFPHRPTEQLFGWVSRPRDRTFRSREMTPRKLPRFHYSLSVLVFSPRNVISVNELVSLYPIGASRFVSAPFR